MRFVSTLFLLSYSVHVMLHRLDLVSWRVYERFSSSGKNDLSLWAEVSKRDTLLDHQYALLRGKDTVSELINAEAGPAVVEGYKTGLRSSSLPDNRGKQQRVLRPDFQALVDSFASNSASAASTHASRS